MDTETTGTSDSGGIALKEISDGTYVVLEGQQLGRSLSTTIIFAVAKVRGKDPVMLDPLAEYVNPDALDLFASSATDGFLSFTYADCRVSIESSGRIHIEPEPTD
jgi:hypothetical protein